MKYTTNSALAICAGIAMLWIAGCASAGHGAESTASAESNTANAPAPASAANSNTSTTTLHDNTLDQGTYKAPDKNTPYRWSGSNAFYVQ